jgi:hypothetical protein
MLDTGGAFALARRDGVALVNHATVRTEFLESTGVLLNGFVILPLGIWLLLHFLDRISNIVPELVSTGVIRPSEERDLTDRLMRLLDSWWAIAVALTISAAINWVTSQRPQPDWRLLSIAGGYFRAFTIINYYMLLLIVIKGVAVVMWVRHDLAPRLRLDGLHYDGRLGLASLGRLLVTFHSFIGLIGVFFVIQTRFSLAPTDAVWPVVVAGYVILGTALVLFSVWPVRAKMKEYRSGALDAWRSTRLHAEEPVQEERVGVVQSLRKEGVGFLEARNFLRALPTWPFELRAVSAVVVNAVAPAVVGILLDLLMN